MKITARSTNNRGVKWLVRGLRTVSIGAAGAYGCLAVYKAAIVDTFDGGSLIMCGTFVILTIGASNCWDDLTDADVLDCLRNAPLPCSAANLARHLGRRPGPVRPSLGRLQRAGLVAPVDTANGVVRYTTRAR